MGEFWGNLVAASHNKIYPKLARFATTGMSFLIARLAK
jgi:hypothetical protein